MDPVSDPVEVVRAALADIERTSIAAVQAIETAEDLDAALVAVRESYDRLREITEVHLQLRTKIAGRVWDAQRLSLSALARRVGVSKSRAEQMIKDVKKEAP